MRETRDAWCQCKQNTSFSKGNIYGILELYSDEQFIGDIGLLIVNSEIGTSNAIIFGSINKKKRFWYFGPLVNTWLCPYMQIVIDFIFVSLHFTHQPYSFSSIYNTNGNTEMLSFIWLTASYLFGRHRLLTNICIFDNGPVGIRKIGILIIIVNRGCTLLIYESFFLFYSAYSYYNFVIGTQVEDGNS